jgi:hypothetical protein
VNTGGGGGGASASTPQARSGGNGGSGVVIITYPATYLPATATTGSPNVIVSGGYRTYKWITSGSIIF